MRYMLLVHHNEEAFARLGSNEQQQMRQESVRLANAIHSRGQYLDASPLHPTSTASSVRIRDGKRLVTDGPFAETREQLGGYFLIDVSDLDEAIRIASEVPGARLGTVEIRPILEISSLLGDPK